ncbi:MAG: hypothetical protein JO065_04715, partial [Acidobacteria bacterium]|nr:hypothetical protein [Acidobacteriota bacterium]
MKSFTKFLGESAAVAIARTTPAQGRNAGIAALLTLTLAIGISGCSHSKKPIANSSQNSQTQSQAAQAVLPAAPAATTAQPEVAKKKSVKGPVRKLPVNRSYIDETSGLSFTYPRRSTLEVGDKAEQDGVVSQQLPMNFVAEGGVTMAVVELPGIAKTGSDFTPAFFTISVNKELSAEQCGEFAGQESSGTASDSSSQSVLPVSGSKQTIGEVEYSELDKQNDDRTMKYYHRFVA